VTSTTSASDSVNATEYCLAWASKSFFDEDL
jgi:hypothetical protein